MRKSDTTERFIIAYPSEKGGYNIVDAIITDPPIIAYPSEKGGYNGVSR